MSLDLIRAVRRRGGRPDGPVTVLIGHKPQWLVDDLHHVCLTASSRVADMDFRPLIGLWVAVLLNEPLREQALRVLQAMEAVTANPYGLVLEDGTVCMGITDPTPAHVANLRAVWEGYQ